MYVEHDPPPKEELNRVRAEGALQYMAKTGTIARGYNAAMQERPPTSCSIAPHPEEMQYTRMTGVGLQQHEHARTPGMFRAASRATLVDQDSGNVYQVRGILYFKPKHCNLIESIYIAKTFSQAFLVGYVTT